MTHREQLDEVLMMIHNYGKAMNITDLDNLMRGSIQRETLIQIRNKLVKDGYIFFYSSNDIFQISFDGIEFARDGGYEGQAKRLLSKRVYERERRELELKHIQSTIDTNTSVQQTNTASVTNAKRQNRLTIASIIVAGASALFALGSIWVSSLDTTSEELQELNKHYQRQLQTLETMQQHQKGIDASLPVRFQEPFQTAFDKARWLLVVSLCTEGNLLGI